jgi:hypothetical protein
MRKLKLEPEELVVESFATDDARRGRVGTVHGQVTLVGPGCASVEVCNTRASIECACNTGACATADVSCNGTCAAACGGGTEFYTDCSPCSQAGHIC